MLSTSFEKVSYSLGVHHVSRMGWPVSPRNSLPTCLWDYMCTRLYLPLLCEFLGSDSGPHVYQASTLPTETSV